ncbi:hypothetical protein JR316_0000842 [Psilocybe cubensis]|uniref:Uncharacterized protein n=2 Tax=Psilocybe cubensis TaxID=181762 RepID=A0ACB8HGI8_PSICU|nr:hypothetical protein JR316_0000842 [Psilocybe cubensis]KAH9486777.1 hypothetical protein JR316_0000842 [Psilocybe cubensis]
MVCTSTGLPRLSYSESIRQPIFQDDNGLAVKFFIQKDLPQEVQAELCETVTSLGGRVEAKVPRQGYILVQPGTAEEERLRLCWTSPDRPERYFVPYTYVEACKIAGMLLKQIFVENGAPLRMHIHPSIANVNARSALSSRIMHSGGDPQASAQSARVILADPNTEVFQHLVKTYQGVSDKYIESYLWVKKCIEKGSVVFTPLVYKNPGGRRPGEERTQFTDQDEEHLCNWIAAKIPYKETGGRTGNRLYQQLCDLSSDPEYAWVTRHTWQSWRERYKKNSSRLDVVIARIVEQKKPIPGDKGQYGYVRQPEDKPKRVRRKKAKTNEHVYQSEEFTNEDATNSMPGPSNLSNIRPEINGAQLHHAITTLQDLADVGSAYSAILPVPSSVPLDRSTIRKSPAEEEDDDPEWAIRISNDSPPSWSTKRKAPDEGDNEKEKRLRVSFVTSTPTADSSLNSESQSPLPPSALVAIADMHVIDQGIRDIARDFRFTVEEVQEFYDKCGEMSQTRMRFQRMREELVAKFSDPKDFKT